MIPVSHSLATVALASFIFVAIRAQETVASAQELDLVNVGTAIGPTLTERITNRKKEIPSFDEVVFYRTLPGVTARDGRRVGCIVLYYQIDFRFSKSAEILGVKIPGGGAGANILLATEICPRLKSGTLSLEPRTYMGDVRPKDWGPGSVANAEKAVLAVADRMYDKQAAILDGIIAADLNSWLQDKAPETLRKSQGHIAAAAMNADKLSITLGPPGDGWATAELLDTAINHHAVMNEWMPPGKTKNDAALSVTVFEEHQQRLYFSERYKPSDKKAIRLYVPENFHRDRLGTRSGAFNAVMWGDQGTTFIVLPGQRYAGHRFRIYWDAGEKARREGKKIDLPVGRFSINLGRYQHFDDEMSQMEVVR